MEVKIKWDGSQEAFDEIQSHFAKLGDGYVESSDKQTLIYTLDGVEYKLPKGRMFKHTIKEEVVEEVAITKSLFDETGAFKSRSLGRVSRRRAAGK